MGVNSGHVEKVLMEKDAQHHMKLTQNLCVNIKEAKLHNLEPSDILNMLWEEAWKNWPSKVK